MQDENTCINQSFSKHFLFNKTPSTFIYIWRRYLINSHHEAILRIMEWFWMPPVVTGNFAVRYVMFSSQISPWGVTGTSNELSTWLHKFFEQPLFSLLRIPDYDLLELIAAASLSCGASCFLWSEEINRSSMGDLFLGVERASVLLVEGEIIQPPSWNA